MHVVLRIIRIVIFKGSWLRELKRKAKVVAAVAKNKGLSRSRRVAV